MKQGGLKLHVGGKIKKTILNIQKEILIKYGIKIVQVGITKMIGVPLGVIKSPQRYSYETLIGYLYDVRNFDFYSYVEKNIKYCKKH